MSGYKNEFEYRKGLNINNENALTILPIQENINEELGLKMLIDQLPTTFHEIIEETKEDSILNKVCDQVKSS